MPQGQESLELGELLYQNPLAQPEDVRDFAMEGSGAVSFPVGRMRLENGLDAALGQKANFVFWCPVEFPDRIAVSWDFWPIREPGLCILFFAAKGQGGEPVLDSRLAPRSGPYDQYHHGDINALHISYFRRKEESERKFHTCNLRKSYGFHLVAQGADPLPPVPDARGPYRLCLSKDGPDVRFSVNGLAVLNWTDNGTDYGSPLGGGSIGFRQMAPLIAEYANLQVHALK